jgi:CDP-6-deoxy-D-xylo-4-hexulose-3-dehydrase
VTDIASLRTDLDNLALKYASVVESREMKPGVDYLPPTGKLVGSPEFGNLIHAAADMWLTSGRFTDRFEEEFPKLWGIKKSLFVNSGSSANLVALASLTSPRLKDRAIKPGDEMITTACGFPTTVAPGLQYGLKPVFVDVDPTTHNAAAESVIAAITPKTKVIMMAHALGNPFRADLLAKVCAERNIWLVEDCCDALGATIKGEHVGRFGAFATCSFYPAHHMTTGEGGAVLTNNANLYKIAMSFRDWGRDCWCPPGVSDSCGIRFEWKLGTLPKGYDHKYIYSHIGFNLKATDFQAAIGLGQLPRVPTFIDARKKNHTYLLEALRKEGLEDTFILPETTPECEASWFGFFLTLREGGAERRSAIVTYLEQHKVGTRLLFGGNLIRQPAFDSVDYRVHGELSHTDKITEEGFWIGIWPGLKKPHLDYMVETLVSAVKQASK